MSQYVQTQDEIQDLQQVAERVAIKANEFSLLGNRDSPFAISSKGYFKGGKQDDITVLIAQIKLLQIDQKEKN